VRGEYPTVFATALPYLQALATPPDRSAAWLEELCRRIEAGSPPEAAAARIPLDWSGVGPKKRTPMPVLTGLGDPVAAGDYPDIAIDHPAAYDRARALMAGLAERPNNPAAWLRELCTRIDAGSPPEAAAARIPLDWEKRQA
jgi:hypothetical protein